MQSPNINRGVTYEISLMYTLCTCNDILTPTSREINTLFPIDAYIYRELLVKVGTGNTRIFSVFEWFTNNFHAAIVSFPQQTISNEVTGHASMLPHFLYKPLWLNVSNNFPIFLLLNRISSGSVVGLQNFIIS